MSPKASASLSASPPPPWRWPMPLTVHDVYNNSPHGSAWPPYMLNIVPSTLRMPGDDTPFSARPMLQYLVRREAFMFDLIGSILDGECRTEKFRCGALWCSRPRNYTSTTPRKLFVDSGANEGFWSLFAASMGCHVISVEPQPHCIAAIQSALSLNVNEDLRIDIWNNYLSAEDEGQASSISVPTDACNGYYSSTDRVASNTSFTSIASRRLDELLQAHEKARIALWHVDTEGAEVTVLRSAARLFEQQRIDRVVFELTPHLWARYNISLSEGFEELGRRFHGWHCEWACTGTAVRPPTRQGWNLTKEDVVKRMSQGRHATGYCHPPWNLQSSANDMFCVRPGIPRRYDPRGYAWHHWHVQQAKLAKEIVNSS